jgi:hypothetical protein
LGEAEKSSVEEVFMIFYSFYVIVGATLTPVSHNITPSERIGSRLFGCSEETKHYGFQRSTNKKISSVAEYERRLDKILK